LSPQVGEAKQLAQKVAGTEWAQGLARWGLVSKGALYLLVGVIATQVSILDSGKLQDRSGALAAVAGNLVGKLLVGAVAVGLAGYAAWRFAEALLGRPLDGGEKEGWIKRVGYFARGCWYLALFGIALSALAGANESSGSREQDRFTARVLELPAGRWLVAAVGLGILGAGGFNVWRAVSGRFRKNLELRKMGELEDRVFTALGVVGHLARGVVFGLIGFFLVRAAYQYDPKETIGLDGALGKVLRQDHGDTLLALVAAGLIAYGLYCFVEARYREV
jgi:uncharacterized protein DUF1206